MVNHPCIRKQYGGSLDFDTPVAQKPRSDSIRIGDEEMLLTVQGDTRFVRVRGTKDGCHD